MSLRSSKTPVPVVVKGETPNEAKLSLKIMVDSKTQKVVFAEAGKDFVDFIFHILSLPLATVVKLLKDEKILGCLPGVGKSIESLKAEYLDQNVTKDSIMMPKFPIIIPLLSLNPTPPTLTLLKCPSHLCLSDRRGATCDHIVYANSLCGRPMKEVTFTYATPESSSKVPGLVKEAVHFMVKDNLEVVPMSGSLIMSNVKGFDSLVEFRVKEGLALLKASLETDEVLTTVFIGNKSKTRRLA